MQSLFAAEFFFQFRNAPEHLLLKFQSRSDERKSPAVKLRVKRKKGTSPGWGDRKYLRTIFTNFLSPQPGVDLFLERKPAVETAGYFLTPLRG
jgi:hypothetical protein